MPAGFSNCLVISHETNLGHVGLELSRAFTFGIPYGDEGGLK